MRELTQYEECIIEEAKKEIHIAMCKIANIYYKAGYSRFTLQDHCTMWSNDGLAKALREYYKGDV